LQQGVAADEPIVQHQQRAVGDAAADSVSGDLEYAAAGDLRGDPGASSPADRVVRDRAVRARGGAVVGDPESVRVGDGILGDRDIVPGRVDAATTRDVLDDVAADDIVAGSNGPDAIVKASIDTIIGDGIAMSCVHDARAGVGVKASLGDLHSGHCGGAPVDRDGGAGGATDRSTLDQAV